MSEDAAFRVVVAQIAHDLANLLTCILACATHVGDATTDRRRDLDAIREAALLGADLLGLLRNQEVVAEPTCVVTPVIQNCATLLQRVGQPRGVALTVTIHGDATVALRAFELQEIVLNLGLNAIEAIAGEGRVELVATLDDEHVNLTVRDDGPGLPAGLLDGDSSKQGHVGVGLGAVRTIVARAGGMIEVSTAATGTSVAVRLPRVS
jgi:signal transduction histidine kinase